LAEFSYKGGVIPLIRAYRFNQSTTSAFPVIDFSALTTLAFSAIQVVTAESFECPITKKPSPQFIPPLPWHPITNSSDTFFLWGTPGLWAVVSNHWRLPRAGHKLPFLSEQYDWKQSGEHPPLAVVARRLDAPAALVWANWVNGAGPPFLYGDGPDFSRRDGFMVTSLAIPSAGCWEISAHFTPARDHVQSLTYIVLVE
jgi:hypothetical protein